MSETKTKLIYDPANTVFGDDVDTSIEFSDPRFISIEGMLAAGLTSVTVQVKIHPDAVWHDYQNVNISNPNALVEFSTPPNYARVVRDGTDDFVVYATKC